MGIAHPTTNRKLPRQVGGLGGSLGGSEYIGRAFHLILDADRTEVDANLLLPKDDERFEWKAHRDVHH